MSFPARRSRITTVASAAALLLLTASCGDDGTTSSAERTSEAPTDSTSESTTTTATAPPTTEPSPTTVEPTQTAVAFDVSMVQSVEINKVNKGGQANVQLIVGTASREDALAVAEGCVEHYLQEQKAAFCHVWSTQANFDARDPAGVGDLMCWTYYVGVPLSGGDPVVTETRPYTFNTSGCPDSIA